jgi:hypothetical protein
MRDSVDQLCNCRAEVRFGGVPEVEDEGVAFEEGLDAGALMAAAAAVNQADLAQAGGVRGGDVFVDERRDIRGREAVKIEDRFDWQLDRFRIVLVHRHVLASDASGASARAASAPARGTLSRTRVR